MSLGKSKNKKSRVLVSVLGGTVISRPSFYFFDNFFLVSSGRKKLNCHKQLSNKGYLYLFLLVCLRWCLNIEQIKMEIGITSFVVYVFG